MAVQVSIREARTHLSRLLARVSAGEEIVITRNGKPVARLTPFEPKQRPLGIFKDQIWIASDFNETPETTIDLFYK